MFVYQRVHVVIWGVNLHTSNRIHGGYQTRLQSSPRVVDTMSPGGSSDGGLSPAFVGCKKKVLVMKFWNYPPVWPLFVSFRKKMVIYKSIYEFHNENRLDTLAVFIVSCLHHRVHAGLHNKGALNTLPLLTIILPWVHCIPTFCWLKTPWPIFILQHN